MAASGLHCVHLLCKNMMYCKENRILCVTSGEFGLEVNTEKIIYMFMYYQCYVGRNCGMKDSR